MISLMCRIVFSVDSRQNLQYKSTVYTEYLHISNAQTTPKGWVKDKVFLDKPHQRVGSGGKSVFLNKPHKRVGSGQNVLR